MEGKEVEVEIVDIRNIENRNIDDLFIIISCNLIM